MQSLSPISVPGTAATQFDRKPPFSPEAEMSVLGGMLIDPDAIVRAIEILDDSMFYREAHRRLFRAMVRVWETGGAIEPVSLSEHLKSAGDFETVGGAAYLAQLWDYVPTAANLEYHARIVREKALLRRLIEVSSSIIQDTYENQGEVDRLLDEAEQRIFQIAQTHDRKGFVWIKEVLYKTFEQIERLQDNHTGITGVPSGFTDLDEKTAGFQAGDLVIVAARPSMGKCLAAASEIVQEDGSVATIEEIYHRRRARLLTLGSDLRLSTTSPSHFVDDGEKPVFAVTTRLGRRVETTLPHPFLTTSGWKRLEELQVGERIAVPRRIPVFGTEEMQAHRVKLLAYLLGDGCLTGSSPAFTSADPRLREEFSRCVEEFGGVSTRLEDSRGLRTPTLCVRKDPDSVRRERLRFAGRLRSALAESGVTGRQLAGSVGVSPATVSHGTTAGTAPGLREFDALCAALPALPEHLDGAAGPQPGNGRNALAGWLDALGLMGCDAHSKFVPDEVFRLTSPLLALFLNRLFATDGWATVLASGQAQLGYSTVSERLARQLQHLLLRFGVIASLRERHVRYGERRRVAWQLDVTDADSIRTFASEIGIFGKEEALERVRRALESRRAHTNRDVIPVEVWERLDAARGGESWAALARRAGLPGWSNLHVGRRGISRDRLARLGIAMGDESVQALARSDVYWDEIVSIEPLGRKQVYDLTIPDTHNFVANDVCVHNTAFVLNIAQHAAIREKKPVAVFSLEMSSESLVMRMLCAEGRIDQGNMRRGRMKDDEYARLATVAGFLNTAPIYIDDTPGISILEMRAKARRLKADRPDLALIVVDYLQLMVGRERTENRQQEVSEISRGLKALAKELEVPVIALSQLSRAVEQRPDKRPLMSDLRECVTGDTLVALTDGRRVPIRDLVGTTPEVWAMAPEGRLVAARSDCVWLVGRRPVFELRLASGRVLRATGRHRLYGADGWVRVADLAPGDRVALARRLPEPAEPQRWPDARVALLGHLIGDGSYLPNRPLRYTTSSEENSALVAESAAAEFGASGTRHPGRGSWHQLLLSGNGNRWHPAGLGLWLRELGIFGQRSHEKRVPESVFTLDNRQVALLLRHLWATDGSISPRTHGRGAHRIYYATTSRGLADDIAALLLRLGIVARIRTVRQGEYRPAFHVDVSGSADQWRFLERVGAFGPRRSPAAHLRVLLAARTANTNVDTLPVDVFDRVRACMREQGISMRRMAELRGTTYGGPAQFRVSPSRALVAEYAEVLDDPVLRQQASNDLFWDKIVDITADGEEDVYDLTVPGPASWLADCTVNHNSGAIEQDSDLILFLYRPEYYFGTVDKEGNSIEGLAEVIIGKQRNGATGSLTLRFLKEYTRFDNFSHRSDDPGA